jgi:hypothetical protein
VERRCRCVVLNQERRAPLPRVLLEQRYQGAALDVGVRLESGHVEKSRGEVDTERYLARCGAGDGQPWISNDERDADGLFVRQAALFVEPVLSVEVSMVAGENDDGVIQRALSLERCEYASQAVIDAQ